MSAVLSDHKEYLHLLRENIYAYNVSTIALELISICNYWLLGSVVYLGIPLDQT